MKINRLETHDRLLIAKKEEDKIQKGFEECKYKNPVAQALLQYSSYIYVFAHKKEVGVDEKREKFITDLNRSLTDMTYIRKYSSIEDVASFRMLWQPRLTKPEAQENSYLFRTLRDSTDVEVYWIIPPKELWNEYKKGDMIQDDIIGNSIYKIRNHPEEMCVAHKDDLSDEKVRDIYRIIKKSNCPVFDMI